MHDVREWIHTQTGSQVIATRRLVGGVTSDVRAVRLASGETLVLRRYTEWPDARPSVEREASALTHVEQSDIPAPRLVAAAPDAAIPMLLMTRAAGRIHLQPRRPDEWLRQLAQMLVRVHAIPAPAERRHDPWIKPSQLEVPNWSARRHLWKETVSLLAQPVADFTPCFVHGDFQHYNMLWTRDRLTALIDWVNARPGHPDADAAHCRLNLAVLFSADHAERFREFYESESGRPIDPWWDLRGLLCYGPEWKHFIPIQVGGRAPIDTAGMDDRVEDLMARILRRL